MMICSKQSYREYLEQDRIALHIERKKPRMIGDEIWKFQIALRRYEYCLNVAGGLLRPLKLGMAYLRYHRLAVKLGLTIPPNVFDKGLAIAHSGAIVINNRASVGQCCRIHPGVTIGATNGINKAAQIGDNCYLGSGAKIIGDIQIADGVAIGANAVVVKSIHESNTTWAGVPAEKVSNNPSSINMFN